MGRRTSPLTGALPPSNASADVRALVLDEKAVRAAAQLDSEDMEALSPQEPFATGAIAVAYGLGSAALAFLIFLPGAWLPLLFLAGACALGVYALSEDSTLAGLSAAGLGLVGVLWLRSKLMDEPDPVLGRALLFGAAGGLSSWLFDWVRHRGAPKRRGLGTLLPLLGDVARYHRVLSALNVSEELQAVSGSSSDPKARAEVLRCLRQTREHLLVALRTERVLRQNKELLEGLEGLPSADLASVEALRIAEVSQDYRKLADDTVSLAADIDQNLRAMRRGQR